MDAIHLRGVKTHNLKNLELVLKHRKLYAVTGVSGSGKSSLAFDTLYAEGQRRFVESLSAYARQFLERMEKPDIESASGLPPAIAIEAKNVISNARSTVGTQTEINDYLRVLFSRVAKTFCPDCGREVVHYAPDTAAERLLKDYPGRQAVVGFEAAFEDKAKTRAADVAELLEKQGFSEFFCGGVFLGAGDVARKRGVRSPLMVCVDRLKLDGRNRKRLTDSLETAFRYGRGEAVTAFESSSGGKGPRFSEHLRCASCARTFRDPVPNLFSFNSPLGACPECQGFGRIITLDWDLVVPDPKRSLAGGAIEPWTKPSAAWEARKLTSFCRRRKISMETPWRDLSEEERRMILEGPRDPDGDYFSVRDFFEYLEKKTYKMHVRIFLSKYRKFVPCHACHETRLKPEALYVRWAGKTIHDYQKASLTELAALLDGAELSA
ncbi:MAG: excinuclease ABC subunit A, partial [Candidatus Omnitrophota bacterium]